MEARRVVCFALLSVLSFCAGAEFSRERVGLDGSWEFVKVGSLEDAPPVSGWRAIEVPGTLKGHNYEQAWFRRTFDVPASWAGRRVWLEFGGVKFDSRVYVNDVRVGGCFNGYDAFRVNATEPIRFGEQNTLLVGVSDWTALFAGEPISLPPVADWSSLRRRPRDKVVAPIGGRFDLYGIWDSVTLLCVPPVYVADCVIRPDLGRQRVVISVQVANAGGTPFREPVTAAIPEANVFAAVDAAVPAGGRAMATLELDAAALKLWWPNEPNLYAAEIRAGGDLLRERFGYREFRCEGGDFLLNGVKVHLLARSWWPHEVPTTEEAVRAKIAMLKENNVNCFRTHTQPWPRLWYELADEMGLMMIPEAAIFADDETYRIEDAAFWNNYEKHLRAMVGALKNHPSVVMWSMGNEFCGVRAKRSSAAEANLARMGVVVKKLDPTRPVVFESDGDPGGVADVIGLHYPNEYPERRLWPNDAYWMDAPNDTRNDNMFWPGENFLWEQQKPLYIGEFLWVPDHSPGVPSIFCGDEAYLNPLAYRYRAKAEAWRMQILAYRHYGVSGFAPWGYDYIKPHDERRPVIETQRAMFRPLAAFVREQDMRFYSGETVARTVELFNDTTATVSAELLWELKDGEERAASGNLRVELAAGGHDERVIEIAIPNVSQRTPLRLRLALLADGNERFEEEWNVEAFPEPAPVLNVPIFLCDPQQNQAMTSYLQGSGAPFTKLGSLDEWSGEGVLVLGPAPHSAGPEVPVIAPPGAAYEALAAKVRAGGRVLALEQTPASNVLPVRLTSMSSTMAFALNPAHPVLKGSGAGDFKWWQGDHMVSRYEPARPASGGGKALVATGTGQGLSHAPLLEIPDGDGAWMLCQLLVAEKLEREPAASLVLEQMLSYLAEYAPPAGRTALAGSEALCNKLRVLGLEFFELEDWADLTAPTVNLLVFQAESEAVAAHAPQLLAFLEQGGTVLVHRPSPAAFDKLRRALALPLSFEPYAGTVSRAEGAPPLVQSLAREDLYWTQEQTSATVMPKRAANMADGIFTVENNADLANAPGNVPDATALSEPPALVSVNRGPGRLVLNSIRWDDAGPNQRRADRFICGLLGALGARFAVPPPATVLEAEDMEPNQGIGAFSKLDDHVLMAANGWLEQPVKVAAAGPYRLRLLAKGTPVNGVYPIVVISIDEREVAQVECASASWDTFEAGVVLPEGGHVLRFAFINDGRTATEDRNLWLDRIEVAAGE